jgi:hypothetical protein
LAESPINDGQPPFDTDPNKLLSDDEMLKLCIERWDAARNHRQGKETQWQRWYKLYRSYAERKNWPHSVNLFIPLVWSTVESFIPRLVTQKPTVEVASRGDENVEAASFHRQLLEFQWSDLNLPMVIADWVKESLIYGTAIVKVGWEKRTMVRRFNRLMPNGSVQEVIDDEFVVADKPFVSLVPLENFYPEPGAPDIEQSRYVCERYKATYYELHDMAEALGWNMAAVNKLKDKQVGAGTDAHGEDNSKSERETTFGSNDSVASKQTAQIWEFEVIEYWEDGRYCVFVTDPELLLMNDWNPFWHGKKPYLRIIDNALPGEFHGVGEPETLNSIQTELNAMHNLGLEGMNRAVFQMFKVRIGSPVTPNATKFKPQGIVWVNQPDDIEPMYNGNAANSAHRAEDNLRMWAQIATGANDNFQGVASDQQQETATGASILAQAAASRVGMKFLQLSSLGLEPLGEMLIALNEQYMGKETQIAIVGPEAATHVSIGPEQLATNGVLLQVRLDIGATDPINREMRLQKAMNMIQIAIQIYGDPNHPVIQVMMKRILDLHDVHLDPAMLGVQPDPAAVAASGGAPSATAADDGGPNIRDVLGTAEGG